jgi:hypothetical protein
VEEKPAGAEQAHEPMPLTAVQQLGNLAAAYKADPVIDLPVHLQPIYDLLTEHGSDRESIRRHLGLTTIAQVFKVEFAVYNRIYRKLAKMVDEGESEELDAIQQSRAAEHEAWLTQEMPTPPAPLLQPAAPVLQASPGSQPKPDSNPSSSPPRQQARLSPRAAAGRPRSRPIYIRGAIQDIHALFQKRGVDPAEVLVATPRLLRAYNVLVDKDKTEAETQKALGISGAYYSQVKRLTMETLVKEAPDLLAFPIPGDAEKTPGPIQHREKWAPGERLRVLKTLRIVADARGINVKKQLGENLFERYLQLTDPARETADIYRQLGDKQTTTLARELLKKLLDRLPEGSISLEELRLRAANQPLGTNDHKTLLKMRDLLAARGQDPWELLASVPKLSKAIIGALTEKAPHIFGFPALEASSSGAINNQAAVVSVGEQLYDLLAEKKHPKEAYAQIRKLARQLDKDPQCIRKLLAGKTHPPAKEILYPLLDFLHVNPEVRERLEAQYQQERANKVAGGRAQQRRPTV